MTTIHDITRCLRRDMDGDLLAAAAYAERISRNAALNPRAPAQDSSNYAEAARILSAEHNEQVAILAGEWADNVTRHGRPCPNDTDGDGDCGRRYCPVCSTRQRIEKGQQ